MKLTALEQLIYDELERSYDSTTTLTSIAYCLGMTKHALAKKLVAMEKKGVIKKKQPRIRDKYKLKGV